MARKVKKGVTFYPAFDTKFSDFKIEGNFTLEIINLADGSSITNAATGTFTELMWPDPGHSATLNGAVSSGADQLTVDSGGTLVVGDRFDDGAGNIYYITDITGNVITVKGKLKANISDNTVLNSKGNTGIYKVDVQIANKGEFLVTATETEYGSYPIKYEVAEHDEDDIYDKLDSGFDSLGATKKITTIA